MEYDDNSTIKDIGERNIKKVILNNLTLPENLIDGFGHDSSFLNINIKPEELLFMNTDSSGLNIAYKLGISNAECIGDLGVSHAISDIIASGGEPMAITIALLLPSDSTVGFVKEVMKGIDKSVAKYGAVLAGGDTKSNSKFSLVVTAIGKGLAENRLTRSGAKEGDLLVVTGTLGDMLLGTIKYRKNITVTEEEKAVLDNALINQNPPFKLGRAIADSQLANACTDISDGLSGALLNICSASECGAVITEDSIPINDALSQFVDSLKLRPMQLSLAGGDWQFLYSVPKNNLDKIKEIARNCGGKISVVGQIVHSKVQVAKTLEGTYRYIKLLENDSFKNHAGGKSYFKGLCELQDCFGEEVPKMQLEEVMSNGKGN